MDEPIYRVHFEMMRVRMRASVNGCPIYRASGRRIVRTAVTVNGWVKKGRKAKKPVPYRDRRSTILPVR